jgi:hypothetical protein
MPYISKTDRETLDPVVDIAVSAMEKKPFEESLGDLNYLFSRIISRHMGQVSYGKIAMATGVLENIKQEFYRRVAASYEDLKIQSNGDIQEYSPEP